MGVGAKRVSTLQTVDTGVRRRGPIVRDKAQIVVRHSERVRLFDGVPHAALKVENGRHDSQCGAEGCINLLYIYDCVWKSCGLHEVCVFA